ncbi:hypothetical protein PT974_00464 [Cladobotryum mycophilum]|uniref:Cytochrome b561 domain-containing protein n=1 Tax=Cladobotryum mycophilum TaxID=491253 RepID=A0ABR0T153_9HYPO
MASAEPSQYCRFGLDKGEIDFCMAVSLYHNHSSSAHDLYLSLNVRRSGASDDAAKLGWTAVGTGSHMEGALMFIVYGDPNKPPHPPTLSVRTAEERHSHPIGIYSEGGHKNVDARVLDAKWTPSAGNKTWTAEFSVVCYGCSNWDGRAISSESLSQPWIWGWNKDQNMRPYHEDVDLQKHSLVTGGFGVFYVDMKNAATHHADEAMPTIQGKNNVHTSEFPITKKKTGLLETLKERPLVHLHGFFMSMAFLVLFPIGAVAIRSGSNKSFKYHWTIQASAMAFALSGAVIAVYMTDGDLFGSPHQIAGTSIAVLLILQAVLGWRHHVDFVRIRRRTWISYGHISLGFILLFGGWANVLSGIILYGLGKLGVFLMATLVLVEIVCVGGWAYLARRRQSAKAMVSKETPESSAAYFALDEMESDDDDDMPATKDEEQKGLMKKA